MFCPPGEITGKTQDSWSDDEKHETGGLFCPSGEITGKTQNSWSDNDEKHETGGLFCPPGEITGKTQNSWSDNDEKIQDGLAIGVNLNNRTIFFVYVHTFQCVTSLQLPI